MKTWDDGVHFIIDDMNRIVPEGVFDAAFRIICREAQPDDSQRVADWIALQKMPEMTERQGALEVYRLAAEYGIAVTCRG